MIRSFGLCIIAIAVLLPAAPSAAGERDLLAVFERVFPGYQVVTLDDLNPDIIRFYRENPEAFAGGRTPAWAPGDYDGRLDLAVLGRKRSSGAVCAKGLFAIITASGRKLHSSGGTCLSPDDMILYNPPGHTVEYLTDRYDAPDATDEEMFAKKTLSFASVEHITWGTAAGVYYWNPGTRRMETESTAD